MKQEIKDNIYYLYDDDGNVLLKITPSDISGNQITLEANNQVFAGPISMLNISGIE